MTLRLPWILLWAGCAGPDLPDPPATSPSPPEVVYLSPAEHLVRASMALRGLRPSPDEITAVQADPEALEGIVDSWLDSDAFGHTVREMHQELFLTRSDTIPQFPSMGLLEGQYTIDIFESTVEAAPRLVEHIVMSDRPYSDVLTSETMLTDELLATIYGLSYDPDGPTWQESRWVDGRPLAGVLSDSEMWRRHVSNGSNFHRGRANFVAATFLCDDFASRSIVVEGGIDLSDERAVADAVRTNPACVGCHQALDPMAAFFWGWEDRVIAYSIEKAHRFGCHWNADNPDDAPDRPEEWCYPLSLYTPAFEDDWQLWDLRGPGFYGSPGDSLADLADHIVADPRFAQCTTRRLTGYLTQIDPEDLPLETIAPLQASFAEDFDTKALARAVVLSDSFRAVQRIDEGTAHPVTPLMTVRPEAYARVVEQLTGFRWLATADGDDCDPGPHTCWGEVDLATTNRYGYLSMAGGVDGLSTTRPTTEPTPTRAMVMERYAFEAAAWVVDHEPERMLVGLSVDDEDEARVRQALTDLHLAILGEAVEVDGEVVDETWALWRGAADRGGPAHAWKLTLGVLLQDPRMVLY